MENNLKELLEQIAIQNKATAKLNIMAAKLLEQHTSVPSLIKEGQEFKEQLSNLAPQKKRLGTYNILSAIKSLRAPKVIHTNIEPEFQHENQLNLFADEEMEPETITQVASKPTVKDKFHKFKNMVAASLVDFGQQHGFVQPNNPDWYNLGHKVGVSVKHMEKQTQGIYNAVINQFSTIAQKAGVAIQLGQEHMKNTSATINELKESFFLVGKKKEIKSLQEKFGNTLALLGFEANDLFHDVPKDNFKSAELVQKEVDQHLVEKLEIIKNGNNYLPKVLEGLSDQHKCEAIYKMVWPKIAENMHDSLQVTMALSKSKDSNKYLKMISDFAKSHNITSDIVLHALNTSPKMLSGYPSVEVLMENKDQIIENAHKYEVFAENNFTLLSSLVSVATDMQKIVSDLNVPQEQKDSLIKAMSQSKIAMDEKNEKAFTFNVIQKNILKVMNEKNLSTGLIQQSQNSTQEPEEVLAVTPSKPKM